MFYFILKIKRPSPAKKLNSLSIFPLPILKTYYRRLTTGWLQTYNRLTLTTALLHVLLQGDYKLTTRRTIAKIHTHTHNNGGHF